MLTEIKATLSFSISTIMEWIYPGMVVFLCLLAAFDLYVGVSNDAVNFMNSAIGSRAARFRTVALVAAVGIFCGAIMSNGMMEIARNGIFDPSDFNFHEVMIIFLAVMVTDVLLLDVFNSLGLPTSTTVSMVFNLLGSALALALVNMVNGGHYFTEYINGGKALSVILAIFVSVGIALVVGTVAQYIARIIFSFNYKKNLTWKIGLFGGFAITCILYFMLYKGMKDLSFMTPELMDSIKSNILFILGGCFLFFTLLSQLLHALKVNVFKVIVLTGTFSLAMAFSGNDLVNFIGVPLAGLSAYQDFVANGTDPNTYLMSALNEPASTPFVYLLGAGVIMVLSITFSKKAHTVMKTEVDLARQSEGDEMFGSSKVARSIVRWSRSLGNTTSSIVPGRIRRAIDTRFQKPLEPDPSGASFDLVRASVNLVVASLLIALGTSLKLPLSTTYVTFMVAMGSSLADRAWSRESAVFRITGVLTVIGGWFVTAAVAFTACFVVALVMYFGGNVAIFVIVIVAIVFLIYNQFKDVAAKKVVGESEGDRLFYDMLMLRDAEAVTPMLKRHLSLAVSDEIKSFADILDKLSQGLTAYELRTLRRANNDLRNTKEHLKSLMRRETICLRRTPVVDAVRLSTPFNLVHNYLRQIYYGLQRISSAGFEHVDNDFTPIDPKQGARYAKIMDELTTAMRAIAQNLETDNFLANEPYVIRCSELRNELTDFRHEIEQNVKDTSLNLNTTALLLHTLQESEQLAREVRQLIKNSRRFLQA